MCNLSREIERRPETEREWCRVGVCGWGVWGGGGGGGGGHREERMYKRKDNASI